MTNRILIVEDEDRIASFVSKGLRAEGFTPTVVGDGITGLDYALTGEFDLMSPGLFWAEMYSSFRIFMSSKRSEPYV